MNEIVELANPLRDIDFKYIEECLQCVRPLAEAIDVLQGEKYCYYGYFLPTLVCLRKKSKRWRPKIRLMCVGCCLMQYKTPCSRDSKMSLRSRKQASLQEWQLWRIQNSKCVGWFGWTRKHGKVRTLFMQVASEELGGNRNPEPEAEHIIVGMLKSTSAVSSHDPIRALRCCKIFRLFGSSFF